ncbi:MAG TPA: tetratricopeptide repeat protein [Spirochaetia bacterium]|nr:tetratricopeptide repeat protein [Spirochaetia bacterium]
MASPPTGTVTFLFTDIEGSTRLWEQKTAEMKVALARHDTLLRSAIESNGGYVFKTVGDAFCAAFATAMDGLRAALDAQAVLAAEPWNVPGGIRVRMGLHTGTAEERDADYFGPALNRTARLFSTGSGGQVLVSLVTAELLRDALPEEVGLRDLGAHRLKDLMRPESIFQVVAPGLRSDFPPLKSLDNHPNNLPLEPTPFIGREKELESASRTLLGESCRVLTLTGVGGTGKTRLALQAAANLTDRFPEGVYFVDLSAIDSPAFVLPAIARTLGLQLSGGRSALEVLRDALRDRPVLLVLDNFEQVMRAVSSVVELLAACPAVKLLVTSREALHIRAENVLPLAPLSAPKVRRAREIGLLQLSQYDSVSLFIERARAVRPDFEATSANAPAIAEICARLDGLPLAVELAAARITALDPQAILERLGERLKLLTGGPADLPFRQRTLRTTIDWSYRMLSPVEQMLFRVMAVFAGGATLGAAETVCACEGEADVLETLSSLVGKSLLWRTDSAGGEPRYQMYESMREYALELTPEEGLKELSSRHAAYFLGFAESNAQALDGPHQREAFDRYEREQENFQAALDYFSASGEPQSEVRLAAALTPLWQVRGYLVEGAENLDRARRRLDQLAPAIQGAAHLSLARIAESQDRYRESLNLLAQAEAAFTAISDRSSLLWVEYERGWCCHRLNTEDEAIRHYTAAWSGSVDGAPGGNARLHALSEVGIGASKAQVGELDEALPYLERSKKFFARTGDDRALVRAILGILMVSYAREDFRSAIGHCREALAVQERLQDHFSLLICLNNLGCLHLHLGEFTDALGAYERLNTAAERSANPHFLAWALAGKAESLLRLGQVEDAEAAAERAVAISRSLDAPFDLGISSRVLAQVHLQQGHFHAALRELAESLPLVEKGGDRVEYRVTVKALEQAKARYQESSPA